MAHFRLHWLTRALLAVAAILPLAAAMPASAAVIGIFDPAFGPAIPNLGFKGSIRLEVSNGCYAAGAAQGVAINGTNDCTVTVDSAQILFYNSTRNTPDNILTTVNLQGSFFSPNYVESMSFDANNQFAGMNTANSDLFQVRVSDPSRAAASLVVIGDSSINYDGYMYLFFFDPASTGVDPAFLVSCPNASTDPETRSMMCNSPRQQSNPAPVVFRTTDVPEPDAAALAGAGLAALIASRRRRTRTSAQSTAGR